MSKEGRIRIAIIDEKKCYPEKCGSLCAKVCPINRSGKQCITIPGKTAEISEMLCTGCGICTHKCPFNAIRIVNLTAKVDVPVHSYGKNRFKLYGLPIPVKGAVVGLIGSNGIGKSTALKVLSGKLIPKTEDNEKQGYNFLIEIFKGNELQAYFERLSKEGIKASFKPQDINKVRESFNGKVEDLLKHFDEKNNLKQITSVFDLKKILQSKVSEISGGELQMVSIAATMLKDADFYFFDEPASYLDVKERLAVARAIRGLAEKGKYVLVVEHDLAVLDYLSDFVHVLFGVKGAYGVVSSRMSVLNGINQYLEGHLKAENIVFRDKELSFSKVAAFEKKCKEYFNYPSFEKSYSKFKLQAKGGSIMECEVVGILGPNAIGKTTFVNVIAGSIEHNNGVFSSGLKLSYKQQYIKAEKDETVLEYVMRNVTDMQLFSSEAEKRLSLKELYENKMTELSGGELQKVLVATAMCKDADLFLLDEPSAFLDVEERLNAAAFIKSVIEKKNKACIVVDHDLLFQDCLCDRFIVFEGEPARFGLALEPKAKEEAMNLFLKNFGVTFRRDAQTLRPRANKPNSVKDREQKKAGKYYYL
ncbi:MAG: ribosome biogenesis/translation initiation ATPase RLI [Candidatus Diapherotrites archaeon]|nr:ribosome biogenesis/translation initiation ATPase RLI [Candidatus Diapherotrites archaeon]